jgi:hypothetical protein
MALVVKVLFPEGEFEVASKFIKVMQADSVAESLKLIGSKVSFAGSREKCTDVSDYVLYKPPANGQPALRCLFFNMSIC